MELKPCPFCGSKAEVGIWYGVMTAKCTNPDCGAEIENGWNSAEETAELWNRRANDV